MTASTPPPDDNPGIFSKESVKRGWKLLTGDNTRVATFSELYDAESQQLDQGNADAASRERPKVLIGVAGEPAIQYTPHDRFGLALSGGGIRSATFNLGVLQSLARLGVLKHVDYLSTVSGGGYAGGFWTAWLHREKRRTGLFPIGLDRRGGERSEIRHLREFSRFLLPRMGFFENGFWAIIMTVFGGMLPSLLAALSVLGITWYIWLTGLIVLTLPAPWDAILSYGALLFYLTSTELRWRRSGRSEKDRVETLSYFAATFLAAGFLFWCITLHARTAPDLVRWPTLTTPQYIMTLPALLGVCVLFLLLFRVVGARLFRNADCIPCLVGLERCATRVLGLTGGMAVIALLWLAAIYLGDQGNELKLRATSLSTGVLALIFVWAKKWLSEPVQQTRGGGFLDFALSWLKRATPKALSTLVWLLFFVLVGTLLHWWGGEKMSVRTWDFWMPLFACVGLVALTVLIFDPARVGMHEFYRSRISRCYLGASNIASGGKENERAARNRHIAERPDDDIKLKDLKEIQRPIHLVCVAANEMSGDQLGNLYRGARSAVLSVNGISLGNKTAALDDLRLSSALTASAAAFNSQMGRVSLDLGSSVGFLMSALNLRLGLWVPHPDNSFRGNYILPGRFFLSELFGVSRTDGKNLHLSDGNHFENFGLYELVRRHCRYIIVSDCGADRDVAFDDLANVLRRVREDFGVEIELDVAPLRPNADHRSCQHAVVGTIHYDCMSGMDKGTILYLKPCLTGDEPPDVLQYSARNGEFPHEGTADQFYDEAQWESYRRLGEHAMDSVLSFQESKDITHNLPDRLFRDARSHWHPAPDDLQVNFLAMSERCASLERELMSDGPERLRNEFFAEAAALSVSEGKTSGNQFAAPDASAEIQILSYLVRVVQIMEDMWVAADLDRYWSHPLNEGWMNYFRRWAATPSFRRWWPVIASMYGLGAREFIGKRFNVGAQDPESPRAIAGKKMAELHLVEIKDTDKYKFFENSFVAQQFLQSAALPKLEDYRVLAFNLHLLGYDGIPSDNVLPVGFVLVTEQFAPAPPAQPTWKVEWLVEQLFVPDSLSGSGFLSKFLEAVLRFYQNPNSVPGRKFSEISVHFKPDDPAGPKEKRPGRAARYERVRDIEFYKSRGFIYTNDSATGSLTLRRVL